MNKTQILHEALIKTGMADHQVINQGYHDAKQMIRAGADIHAFWKGKNAIGALLWHPIKDRPSQYSEKVSQERTRNLLASEIINRGGSPWEGDPNVWDTPHIDGEALVHMLRYLAFRQLKGHSILGPGGQTPAHAFIHRYRGIDAFDIHDYLRGRLAWHAKAHIPQMQWFQTRDQSGNLPLHTLWKRALDVPGDHATEFLRYAVNIQRIIARETDTPRGVWTNMHGGEGTGAMRAVMNEKNHAGERVADCFLSAVHSNPEFLSSVKETYPMWVQMAEEVVLQDSTPAVKREKRGVRL